MISFLAMLMVLVQEEGHHSQVRLPNGVHWEPESCWDNIYDAISDARVLIYVVGEPCKQSLVECCACHVLLFKALAYAAVSAFVILALLPSS